MIVGWAEHQNFGHAQSCNRPSGRSLVNASVSLRKPEREPAEPSGSTDPVAAEVLGSFCTCLGRLVRFDKLSKTPRAGVTF